ncbi:hypothetical protein Tco_0603388 [Tanacetum coccineum]
MIASIPMIFPLANSTDYSVSMVDGMPFKGLILAEVRLLSTGFHVLAIISFFALTLGPLEVLSVLMDSQAGGKGYLVWNHQSHWQIRSWRLYTLSNVHVLETVSGEVLYMFSDVIYPLSLKLWKG